MSCILKFKNAILKINVTNKVTLRFQAQENNLNE